jgi:precorrin-2 dehydrogenase/sirohydrochlorin ferrochelatase
MPSHDSAHVRGRFVSLRHYPIFLDLRGLPVLVVGAGNVAIRKTRGLVEAGARVTVVAPRQEPGFAELPVRMVTRRFRIADLAGARLVFAATDDRRMNRRIGVAARSRGIFVNIADSAEECGFLVPARVQRGNLQIAISTGGVNPRLAAALRCRLDEILPGES